MNRTGLFASRGADFSEDRAYRYALAIAWDERLPWCQWVGLNPSTADEERDDPTMRKVQAFSQAWGYGGVVMTNLFAWRSTSPVMLSYQPDPVGPRNTIEYLRRPMGIEPARVVAAWGSSWPLRLNARVLEVAAAFDPLWCVGHTSRGDPRHPLYVRADAQLVEWNPHGGKA